MDVQWGASHDKRGEIAGAGSRGGGRVVAQSSSMATIGRVHRFLVSALPQSLLHPSLLLKTPFQSSFRSASLVSISAFSVAQAQQSRSQITSDRLWQRHQRLRVWFISQRNRPSPCL